MKVITHRGLDPSIPNFPSESSEEAFRNQLKRGYGLEFDVRLSDNGIILVSHEKITKNNERKMVTVSKLLSMIEIETKETISAIHLKKDSQTKVCIDKLLEILKNRNLNRYILFDATIETATYIKLKNSYLSIAASVSHPYDIKRYNEVVGGTLYSIDDLLAHKDLFSWAWLDEWDTRDENDSEKKFLTAETFQRIREAGLKIGLVTPELHGTSPGLLGGESHPDATPHETRWKKRVEEIVALKPDLICTDYPDEVATMAK